VEEIKEERILTKVKAVVLGDFPNQAIPPLPHCKIEVGSQLLC
jgi:hypothetical protein